MFSDKIYEKIERLKTKVREFEINAENGTCNNCSKRRDSFCIPKKKFLYSLNRYCSQWNKNAI